MNENILFSNMIQRKLKNKNVGGMSYGGEGGGGGLKTEKFCYED